MIVFKTSYPSGFKPTVLLTLILIFICTTTTAFSTTASSSPTTTTSKPPIVYTIAGSDSGGGAGIQADLHAIQAMGCHGCSAITCLTAQNSQGVNGVHSPPVDFLRLQLDTLEKDLYPNAIKIGMLGSKDLALEVGDFLKRMKQRNDDRKGEDGDREHETAFVVFDPVMISTSGHKLIEDEAKEAVIKAVFPYVDVVTPNKFEAEEILGRTLNSPEDVEKGAQDILEMGVKAVLIKGGHSLSESQGKSNSNNNNLSEEINATLGYAQDYFLSSEAPLTPDKERICDGSRGVWLRANRFDSIHTHGTGCTLSSVIASALALGQKQRSIDENIVGTGAARAIYMIDACCIAKAYVTEGLRQGVQLGSGPGPVVHTSFPSSYNSFPSVALNPNDEKSVPFLKLKSAFALKSEEDKDTVTLGKVLPILNNQEWVERLSLLDEITDIQLRIKDETDEDKIFEIVQNCQEICANNNVRLWINDYWRAAVKANCFGVHVGQEDLAKCIDDGGLDKIRECNMALGISTHSYAELAAAFGVKPSYISLGPVFGTKSKNVAFDPQGLETVKKWKELIDPEVPLVAIGGINDAEIVSQVRRAGADCVAVISAVTKASNVDQAVQDLNSAMDVC